MRILLFFLRKEFLQIFRNKGMLPIIFAMPVIQLLVLSYAATFEVSSTRVYLIDEDHTPTSRLVVDRFARSGYFNVVARSGSNRLAGDALLGREVNMILHLPHNLERDLSLGRPVPVQIILNAEDGAAAGIVQSYALSILNSVTSDPAAEFWNDSGQRSSSRIPLLSKEGIQGWFASSPGSEVVGSHAPSPKPVSAGVIPGQSNRIQNPESEIQNRQVGGLPASPGPRIEVESSYWYNPTLSYKSYMVPGILVILVTMIGAFLSGMNIVKEKEMGTIEQLNVTPIRKYQFILGKLLPFWMLALVELAFGLVVAKLVFHIPMLGSIGLVFLCAAVYLLVMLGIGLWVSTLTETQQQAMFITWFLVVVFILLSGLFTPVESMPRWAQTLTKVNPIAHFIGIMRAILLKGAGFNDVSTSFFALLGGAALVLSLAVKQYRKTTA